MSDLNSSACASRAGLDPRKRVNFTTGLVLGEDEFVQEQTHLRERDHARVRSLHGYGTVSGLSVSWDDDARQIRVAPGVAVDPVGRLVCVPATQCADLSRWLNEHRDEVDAAIEAAGREDRRFGLYVVLCHRECETDTVPVPTDSCRSADESMAASRIVESFDLRLLFSPPVPAGEPAGGGLDAAVEQLLELASRLRDDAEVDDDAVRQELREWSTQRRPELEDRPCLSAPEDDCGDDDGPSTAVLLARIELSAEVVSGGAIQPREPQVDDADRPVLLSTRYLQEWLTQLVAHPELFAPGDHSVLDNLGADDHRQYLPADGSRPLTGPLDAGGHQLRQVGPSSADSDAMRRDEIVGNDLDHTRDGLRISQLQGEEVAASGENAPQEGDVLRYDGRRWVPAQLPISEQPQLPRLQLPFATIQQVARRESAATFLVWCHIQAPDNDAIIGTRSSGFGLEYPAHLEILEERSDHDGLTRKIASNLVGIRRTSANAFRVDVNRREANLLRFVFHLADLVVWSDRTGEEPVALTDYVNDRGIRYVGQEDDDTVTIFVVNPSVNEPLHGFDRTDALVLPGGGGRIPIERG